MCPMSFEFEKNPRYIIDTNDNTVYRVTKLLAIKRVSIVIQLKRKKTNETISELI